MSPINTLVDKVKALYEARNPNRADWADWLYQNHVFVVAKYAEDLAQRFGAQKDLSVASAVLHDIADAYMPRSDSNHEEESLSLARKLLHESRFTDNDIKIIEDGLINHSCADGNIPNTLEGKVLATADALTHLLTDFYDYSIVMHRKHNKTDEEIKQWALAKIERDYHKKIFFDEIRSEVTPNYEKLKKQFTEF